MKPAAVFVAFFAALTLAVGAVNAEPDPATITLTVTDYQLLTRQAAERDTYARRWAQERRNAVARARTIRKLRRLNRAFLRVPGYGVAGGFRCIQGYEGPWDDPDPPYWGGMQMDLQFQRTYGSEFLAALGTADRWPPFLQVAVAMRAYYSGRGFSPWPSTRKRCGL